jgi:hypothetical protein
VTFAGLVAEGYDQDDTVFISSSITALGQSQELFTDVGVPLCNQDYLTADADNEYGDCPNNGVYNFTVNYQLPVLDAMTGWFATGWTGTAYLKLEDNTSLLGECTMSIETFVTSGSNSGFMRTPSAKSAAGISVGVLAALMLGCCYFWCCCCKKRNVKDVDESEFIRMKDSKSLSWR